MVNRSFIHHFEVIQETSTADGGTVLFPTLNNLLLEVK